MPAGMARNYSYTDQASVDTHIVQMHNRKIDEGASENNFDSGPFRIDSPLKDVHEQMILEKPEDESMLLKASGFSLNTTNLVNNPLLEEDDDLESILSLQPEKLDLKNLFSGH